LTVASKVKVDGKVKLHLVLDLSRKINAAVDLDPFRLTTVNDALAATKNGFFYAETFLLRCILSCF
jgi:hypothetical protein